MSEVPKVATVYKNNDIFYMTVRQGTNIQTYNCSDIQSIRNLNFNQIYIINMELSDLPVLLKIILRCSLIKEEDTSIESIYYERDKNDQ